MVLNCKEKCVFDGKKKLKNLGILWKNQYKKNMACTRIKDK
jgi:hypothetical protein